MNELILYYACMHSTCFLFIRSTAKWHMEERIQQTGNERKRNVAGNVERVPRYVFGQ